MTGPGCDASTHGARRLGLVLRRLMEAAEGLLLAQGRHPDAVRRRLARGAYRMRDLLLMLGEGRSRLPVLEWNPWGEEEQEVERLVPTVVPRLKGRQGQQVHHRGTGSTEA